MGRAIIECIGEDAIATFAGAWDRPNSDVSQLQVGDTTVDVVSDIGELAGHIDVIIDFTTPEATVQHATWCAEQGVALVIGTTGLTTTHLAHLDACAQAIPIVQAPNMSIGVNVMLAVAAKAARMLGRDYDLEIVESHHKHKVDAPSGTALRIFEALQSVRPQAKGRHVRDGYTGPRTPDEIGVQTLRGGDVVGEHTVFYFGEGERLEITHRATDRRIFARGAVRAACWATAQPKGRYSMADVLT